MVPTLSPLAAPIGWDIARKERRPVIAQITNAYLLEVVQRLQAKRL